MVTSINQYPPAKITARDAPPICQLPVRIKMPMAIGKARMAAVKAANCRGERFLAEDIENQCDN
jgi:hypothetical protein